MHYDYSALTPTFTIWPCGQAGRHHAWRLCFLAAGPPLTGERSTDSLYSAVRTAAGTL